MAIFTLLEHLKNTQKTITIQVGPVTLTDTRIDDYNISQSSLWIVTNDNNEVDLNIENFSKIDFDAIKSEAKSSIEMYQCFSALYDSVSYNAYLRDNDNNIIINFNRIPVDY